MHWRTAIIGAVVAILTWWAWEASAHLPGYVGPHTDQGDVPIIVRECTALGYIVETPLGPRPAFGCLMGDMTFPSSNPRLQGGSCAIETTDEHETLWLCKDGSYILKRRHEHS